MAANTYNVRIQLKSDTEEHWLQHPITPLAGELIIYSPDDTHSYSRAKIGDGQTNVTNLPFIGTLLRYNNFNLFPSPGATDKLYLDLSTSLVYYYVPTSGYTQIMPANTTNATIHNPVYWGAGRMTKASVADGILNIKNGIVPELRRSDVQVVTSIIGGAST